VSKLIAPNVGGKARRGILQLAGHWARSQKRGGAQLVKRGEEKKEGSKVSIR